MCKKTEKFRLYILKRVTDYKLFQQFISSEILSGSVGVFFSEVFLINRRADIHKLKQQVKF